MSRRPALPVSLYLEGRRVLVVGDGPAARERSERLRRALARVEPIGAEAFGAGACRGAFAVFACTDDRRRDRAIAETARAEGCLTYAQDVPDASDLAMPAVAGRGALQIAISTEGVAPALARRVREELERAFSEAGEALDRLLEELERRRAALAPGEPRSRLYQLARRFRLHGGFRVDRDQGGDGA